MTGIHEAYANFKARKKASRGMFVVIANDQVLLEKTKMGYPGAKIFVPFGPEDGDLVLVWDGTK